MRASLLLLQNADQQQQQTQLAPPPQHDDNEAVGEPGRPGASPAIPWNDMYQSIVEMSESTFNQSVEKARRLNGLVDAFVRCARRVARVIVDEYTLPPHLKTIAPIDRIDAAPEDETFTSDGIAFTFMHEQNGSEAQDELQRKMGTHDLHGACVPGGRACVRARGASLTVSAARASVGTTAYANVPATSSDLHTHLCCVVDYLGFRLFCLALVPIYDDTRVTFGRVGGALQREARTEALLEAAARDLHLATHDAFVEEGAQGETVAIHAASSVMVHRGEDQRLYVTNLTRAFPVDRNRDGTDPAGVGQLRPEFLRLYAKALSPDAFLVGGTADADGNDDDVAQACRYLRDTVVGEFVKQMDLLALVPVDSAHLTALMHDRGINARYLGAIADTTALPHVREMAVCEMVARTCKAVLQRSWRRRARSARASAGRRPDHPRLHDDDAKLDQALRQAARQQAGAQRDAAVDLFNAVLGHDADFWRRCIAERLARKFAYAISAEESRALHRPLLLAALQHHCGVRLVDAGARRTGPPAPLTRQQVVAIDARCKWPTISSLRCHLFPKKADQYLRDGAFDMAVQALRLRLDVMVGAGDDDLGGSAPQTPTSASSSSLPPAPPPPHRKGGGSTGPVPGAGAADLSQGGGGGGDNDDNGWSASGAEAHRTLNDLCEAYLCQGDVGEARRAAQRALRLSAGADARTCQTYALLVGVYGALGESGRAQQALHLALSMTRHLYGPHHPLLLRLLDEAGTRALQAGDAADAEQRYRAAIDLALTSLGKSHPTTATFYTRVGNVLHLGGHLDKAKDAHEKACLIYEGLYGPASIDVARSCFYLSDILARKGDHQTARYYNQRALKIRQQLLGDEAPDTLDSFHQVAWQAHHREDHDEAIPYFEALLARYKAMPAPTDAALADIRRMTKAVIRLAMRALPMDQVAFLDRVYQVRVVVVVVAVGWRAERHRV